MSTDSPSTEIPVEQTTQYPNKPCDPRAIHDKYPPIGTPPPKPEKGN